MSKKRIERAAPVVLVVEADPLVRMAAISIVERAGCSALRAGSAEDALRILETERGIRLVIADAGIEGEYDGLSLAHAVRRRWPPVPLLLVSAKRVLTEAELPARTRFLAKSFEEAAIAAAIRELLDPGGNASAPSADGRPAVFRGSGASSSSQSDAR